MNIVTLNSKVRKALEPIDLKKTTFAERGKKNLFDGTYVDGMMLTSNNILYTRSNYNDYRGKIAVIPIEPNKTYYIKVHEPTKSNSLKLATTAAYPEFPDSYHNDNTLRTILSSVSQKDTYFTSQTGEAYAIIMVSNEGLEPLLQVEEGVWYTDFEPYYQISESVLPQIKTPEINISSNIAVEHPETGYPARPDMPSVVWIGVNEPTGAEPFDEWRETVGFTYYTDFNEYIIDDKPNDWEDSFTPFAINKIVVDGNEKALKLEPSGHTASGMVWGDVSNDPLDNEIYMKARLGTAGNGQMLAALHRSVSEIDKEGYVTVGISNANLRVARRGALETSTTQLAISAHNIDPDRMYHQRSRIDGGRIRAKIWQDGDPEPSGWLIDVSDVLPMTTTQGLGLYSYLKYDVYVYDFSVGSNGMRAPKRKLK